VKGATFLLVLLACVSACKGRSHDTTALPKEPAPKEPTFRFGDLTALGDGTHFNLDLIEDSETGGSSRRTGSSGSGEASGTTHNLYFYDAATRRGHWLLPDDRSIVAAEYLLKPEADDPQHPSPKPRWELLLLISRDTSGDGLVGTDDRGVLAITNVAGEGTTELVRDVVEVANDPLLIDEHQALVKLEVPAGVALVQIDLEKRSVESVLALSPAEQKPGHASVGK
jgi:hypothetical protein